MGSSQTRARTRVPCIGRQILNHCATREALLEDFKQEDENDFVFLMVTLTAAEGGSRVTTRGPLSFGRDKGGLHQGESSGPETTALGL